MFRTVKAWHVVITGFVIGTALAVAEAANGASIDRVVSAFLIVVAFSLIVAGLQQRSETAAVLAGNPVDERWRAINDRAATLTATVGVGVSLGGFMITEFLRRDSWQFAAIAGAMGATYVLGVFWYRSRT